MDEALALADTIADNAPLAVRASKRVMKEAGELPDAEGWAINNAAVPEVFGSADAMEGADRLRREAQAQLDRQVAPRRPDATAELPGETASTPSWPRPAGQRRRRHALGRARRLPAHPPRAGRHRLGGRAVHRGRPPAHRAHVGRRGTEEGGPGPRPAPVARLRRARGHRLLEHQRPHGQGRLLGLEDRPRGQDRGGGRRRGGRLPPPAAPPRKGGMAVWGAVGAVASVAALCLGVFLAG